MVCAYWIEESCASTWRATAFGMVYGLGAMGSTVCLYSLDVLRRQEVEPFSSSCNMMGMNDTVNTWGGLWMSILYNRSDSVWLQT